MGKFESFGYAQDDRKENVGAEVTVRAGKMIHREFGNRAITY